MFYRAFSGTLVPVGSLRWGPPVHHAQAKALVNTLAITCELAAYIESPWRAVGNFYEAPCTLVVEGVHVGSHGSVYWAAHILRENAAKWEGVPVTLGHPQYQGENISVKHPQAPAPIGRVIRPRFDPRKKAIVVTLQIPRDTPDAAEIMKLKEISMGVFSEETETYGTWEGEEYSKCSITMEPDHAAILPPGITGACNFDRDGCGIRTNQETKPPARKDETMLSDEEIILVAQAITTLKKGETIMSTNEILLPPGVKPDQPENGLQTLEETLDNFEGAGILAPPSIQMAASQLRMQEAHAAGQEKGKETASSGQGGKATSGAGPMLLPPGVE